MLDRDEIKRKYNVTDEGLDRVKNAVLINLMGVLYKSDVFSISTIDCFGMSYHGLARLVEVGSKNIEKDLGSLQDDDSIPYTKETIYLAINELVEEGLLEARSVYTELLYLTYTGYAFLRRN